jgi:hypothetical protein
MRSRSSKFGGRGPCSSFTCPRPDICIVERPKTIVRRHARVFTAGSVRRLLCSLTTLGLAACTTVPSDVSSVAPALNGLWMGQVTWQSSQPFEGVSAGVIEVILSNCDGKPRFFHKGDKGYLRGPAKHRYERNRTTHLLYYIDQEDRPDPTWVESQSWALVELPSNGLLLSWSRSVNNRLADSRYPMRAFAQTGMGQLRRASSECGEFK